MAGSAGRFGHGSFRLPVWGATTPLPRPLFFGSQEFKSLFKPLGLPFDSPRFSGMLAILLERNANAKQTNRIIAFQTADQHSTGQY